MNNTVKKLTVNLILSLLASICLLLPDYLFSFFHNAYRIEFRQLQYFIIFFVFGFILISSKNYRLTCFVLILFAFFEITQFCSLAYFNDYIDPYSIELMFEEVAEISLVAGNSFFSLLYAPLIVIIPYLILFFVIKKSWKSQLKIKFFSILLIIFLIFPAVRIPFQRDILRVFPYKKLPSLANSLNSYSAFFFYFLPKKFTQDEGKKFLPYEIVKKKDVQKTTIVFVVGESFTFSRMSLFGAKNDTTPRLNLLKNDKNFIYKKGFSSATATRATMPLLFNIQYNPMNQDIIKKQNSNMFKLAKDAGFKTFFISAQSSNCLTGIGTKFIDYFVSFDSKKDIFEKYKDEGLLKIAKSLDLGDQNFIVLHQRNIHDPFINNYNHRKEFIKFPVSNHLSYDEKRKNAYDNGVLYNDFLISEIIKYYKSLGEKTYIFVTSDHGEAFGEKRGYYGHTKLIEACYSVPFLFYSNNTDGEIEKEVKEKFYPTHYEVGNLIAECMGYEIKNPNLEENIYYVNGPAAFGMSGYAKIKKNKKEKKFEIKIFGQRAK